MRSCASSISGTSTPGNRPPSGWFDSQLTPYATLNRLNQRGIRFLTLRRRSRRRLGQIWSRPASAWRRITLPALRRAVRTPRVLDEQLQLRTERLRRTVALDHAHRPRARGTDYPAHHQLPQRVPDPGDTLCPADVDREWKFPSDPVLPPRCAVLDGGLKVDFDLPITLMARSLYRLMADQIGGEYRKAQVKTIFRHLLAVSATVQIQQKAVIVTLDKRAPNPYLVASSLADRSAPMPWFGNRRLFIRFA
jgi:hypothetical protein